MTGERLKKARNALNFSSSRKFAEQIGVEDYIIKDIESGKTKNIKPLIAETIESKFNISGWWLLTGSGEMFIEKEKIANKDCFIYHFHSTAKTVNGYEESYDGVLKRKDKILTMEDYREIKDWIYSQNPEYIRKTIAITNLSLLN